MSIVLLPSTPEELAKVIQFLVENQMDHQVPTDYNPMESEDLFTNNKDNLVALLTAIQNKNLVDNTTLDKGGWLCYLPKQEYSTTVKWFKPTPEFRYFCGSEYCNPLGHITLDMAEAVIILHAKARCMATSTHITLSKELQTALNTNASSFSVYELHNYLQQLFTLV